MPGPPPKDPTQRRRRNAPAAGEWRTLSDEPYKGRKPRMPRGLHSATQRTWRAWWASPMAHEWTEGDWPGLERLIWLIDVFHTAPSTTAKLDAMKEARLQEDRYGLSPKGRQALRWRLPDEVAPRPQRRTAAKAGDRWAGLRVVEPGTAAAQ